MRFLVSAYTGLGNFILKTPMICKIRELWPEAEIDLIAGNSFGTEFVLEGSELVNRTYILKTNAPLDAKLKFFLSLRKRRYDAVFLPFDAAPKFLILGALLIGGIKFAHINLYTKSNIRRRFQNLVFLFVLPGFQFVPFLRGRHEIDLNYDLLEAFYNRPMERTYRTFISQRNEPAVLERFNIVPGQYIAIQPSAANGGLTAKVWAPENFKELVRLIHARYPDLKIVFVGDRGDLDSIRHTPLDEIESVVNTMGQTSIPELSTIINNSALVVAHDSGTMHIATAVGVRLIALYGPTDFTRTRPLGENNHILYSKNECFGVHYEFETSESDLAKRYPHNECMEGIKTEDVMDKVNEMLSGHLRENSTA